MEPVTLGELFRQLHTGGFGFLLSLSLGVVVAGSLVELALALRVLHHFRRIGPVKADLLDAVRADWDRRTIPVLAVRGFVGAGLFLSLALLLLAVAGLSLDAWRLGAVPWSRESWRSTLGASLIAVDVSLFVLLSALGVRLVIGAGTRLVLGRARWYVRAGEALPSRSQIARLEELASTLDEELSEP